MSLVYNVQNTVIFISDNLLHVTEREIKMIYVGNFMDIKLWNPRILIFKNSKEDIL